jgi:formate dehydrogenase iron-sulfur subunit
VIQVYEEGDTFSYARQGCMHCVEPACVAACPVHALEKFEDGPVLYDPSRCIGCRYCMLACPFNVPRYTWDQSIGVIAKCTFCDDRLEMGMSTACSERCPTDALVFGTRGELLDEAETRLAEEPDKYVDHVYGKHDAGGTSVLHIAAVPLEKLGLPDLGHEPVPELNDKLAVSILPSVFIGGTILLAGLRFFTTRGQRGEEARYDHS